jgi:hypothetical protein
VCRFLCSALLVGVSACASNSGRIPAPVADARGWAPGCYETNGTILTPGSAGEGERVWLVLENRGAREKFTHPWYRAAFLDSGNPPSRQAARWTSFAHDTLRVTWHNGFAGVDLTLVRAPNGLSGIGELSTDQLVQVGPNSFAQSTNQWTASFRSVSCDTAPR